MAIRCKLCGYKMSDSAALVGSVVKWVKDAYGSSSVIKSNIVAEAASEVGLKCPGCNKYPEWESC